MKLSFRKSGEGRPLIFLHGLFGMSDNFMTLAKSFSDRGFGCYLIDQRNHGKSPHSKDFNYDLMTEDLFEFFESEEIGRADIIGHSMGAKTAMFFAAAHEKYINKLIIADMAPRFYPPHHQIIFSALNALKPEEYRSRSEAEERLRQHLKDEDTIQFLLKNLYWKEDDLLDWRFGLSEIEENMNEIGKALPQDTVVRVPTLFLRGQHSDYITDEDLKDIKRIFPQSSVEVIPNAGHWLHAENPGEFLRLSLDFLE